LLHPLPVVKELDAFSRAADRPGAVGTIAGSEVLRQAADGHSLYLMNAPVTAAPALLANMPYDLVRDFAPVVRISTSYNVLVVHPSIPARLIAEFTALLKSRPNELAFSSAGYGSPAHLIAELFMLQTGVRARHASLSFRARRQSTTEATTRLPELNPHHASPGSCAVRKTGGSARRRDGRSSRRCCA
jgi:tripartite-type tricarboxylate transporter receptor subunit TctC